MAEDFEKILSEYATYLDEHIVSRIIFAFLFKMLQSYKHIIYSQIYTFSVYRFFIAIISAIVIPNP